VDLGLFVPFAIASSSRGDREKDLTFAVVFLFVFETGTAVVRGSGSRTRNGEVSSPRTREWIILFVFGCAPAAFEDEALRKFFSQRRR
jgi:hypothetical protein